MKQQTQQVQLQHRRRETLARHVTAWAHVHPKKRTGVALDVVQAYYDLGLDGLMADEMLWKTDGELADQLRVNTQKLWRWLDGFVDGRASLFCIEQAIVTAMPVDRRIAYLNEVYDCASLMTAEKPTTGAHAVIEHILRNCIHEDAEADSALVDALADHSPTVLHRALEEQERALAARISGVQAIRDLLQQKTNTH